MSTPFPEYGMLLHLVVFNNVLLYSVVNLFVRFIPWCVILKLLKILKILPFSYYIFCLSLVPRKCDFYLLILYSTILLNPFVSFNILCIYSFRYLCQQSPFVENDPFFCFFLLIICISSVLSTLVSTSRTLLSRSSGGWLLGVNSDFKKNYSEIAPLSVLAGDVFIRLRRFLPTSDFW